MRMQTPDAEFATAADRIETFLRDRKPRLAAGPAALAEALAAAAAAFGTTMPPGLQIGDGEAAAAALERLAAASGLLVRPVPLATSGSGDTAAPIIAFEAAGGTPVLIGRQGRRWSIATQQTDWIAKAAPTLDIGKFNATGYMVLPAFPDGPIGLRQLFGFTARRNVKELAGLLLVTMAAGVIAAIMPLVSAPLLEIVVPARNMWLLGEIAVFLVAVVAADLMTRALVGLIRVRLEGRSGLMLRAAAIDRALRIADRLAETGQAPPAAPLAALSARCVETWHRGAWGLGLTLATSLLLALPSIIVMAQASLRGAMIVALVFLAAFGLAAWVARLRIEALTKGLATPQSWMATAYEGLAMIDTIRAGAAEGRLFSRWTDEFLALRHRFLRADRIGAGAAAIERGSESLLVLAALLALALSGSAVTGLATVTFVVAVGNVTGAAAALLGALDQVAMLALQYRMIEPILGGEPRPRSQQPSAAVPAGRIELAHVDCRLSARGPRVLTDISLTIEPGEHIGIAGPSGAGKSTLLRVILGLIQPEAGHVLFDGRDLAGTRCRGNAPPDRRGRTRSAAVSRHALRQYCSGRAADDRHGHGGGAARRHRGRDSGAAARARDADRRYGLRLLRRPGAAHPAGPRAGLEAEAARAR